MMNELREENDEESNKLLLDLFKTSYNFDENIIQKNERVEIGSVGLKLFQFSHCFLPMVSRRQLHRIFERKTNIIYNGRIVGREDENIRVKTGDMLEITLTGRELIVDSFEYEEVKILEENDEYCVIEKAAGMNSCVGSFFEYVFRLKCWNGKYHHSCCSLFSIDKAASGLIIIAKNKEVLNNLIAFGGGDRIGFKMWFSCVVCSSSLLSFPISCKNEVFVLQTSGELDFMESLSVKIISTVPTRSLGEAALVEIAVDWKGYIKGQNLELWSKQVSLDTKRVKNVLRKRGMMVIGHDGTGIKGKGLYLSWNKLTVGNTSFEILVPKKLTSFLEKEAYYYHLNQKKLLEQYEISSEIVLYNNQNSEVDGGIPFEYRIGKARFHNLEFNVNENVMIPRKSTEALVDYAVKSVKERTIALSDDRFKSLIACLDLGTGSGCLLLSLLSSLHELSSHSSSISSYSLYGQGIDVSEKALDVARTNSEKFNLTPYTSFAMGCFEEVRSWYPKKKFDSVSDDVLFDGYSLITCNPPYSANKERNRLSLSSKSYEPSLALFADESDSLKCYQAIVNSLVNYENLKKLDCCDPENFSPVLFKDNCLFVLEIGSGQMNRVLDIFSKLVPFWSFITVIKDYKNVNRGLVFRYQQVY
jgi:HemK-like putative methylase